MKRAITTIITILIVCSSTVSAQVVYVSSYRLGRPDMVHAIGMLKAAGFTLSTDRRSSELELRIQHSSWRKEMYGQFGGARGGYRQREYVVTITLIERETGKLISNGIGAALYSLDVRVPMPRRSRHHRFGRILISSRSVNFGVRISRDEAKELATREAVREMIAKYQGKTRELECPAGEKRIYEVVIDLFNH